MFTKFFLMCQFLPVCLNKGTHFQLNTFHRILNADNTGTTAIPVQKQIFPALPSHPVRSTRTAISAKIRNIILRIYSGGDTEHALPSLSGEHIYNIPSDHSTHTISHTRAASLSNGTCCFVKSPVHPTTTARPAHMRHTRARAGASDDDHSGGVVCVMRRISYTLSCART